MIHINSLLNKNYVPYNKIAKISFGIVLNKISSVKFEIFLTYIAISLLLKSLIAATLITSMVT